MNLRPLAKAIVGVLAPALAALVFYTGVRGAFTNNRLFDALIALSLLIGAYCGITAYRAKAAHVAVRGLGLLAGIVCVPYGLFMVFITIFGLG